MRPKASGRSKSHNSLIRKASKDRRGQKIEIPLTFVGLSLPSRPADEKKTNCRKRSFILLLRETPLTPQTSKLNGNLLNARPLVTPKCFGLSGPQHQRRNTTSCSLRNSCHPFSIGLIELRSSFKCVIPTLTTMTGNLETRRRCFATLKIQVK